MFNIISFFLAILQVIGEEEGPEDEVGEDGYENEEDVLVPGVLFVDRRTHRRDCLCKS